MLIKRKTAVYIFLFFFLFLLIQFYLNFKYVEVYPAVIMPGFGESKPYKTKDADSASSKIISDFEVWAFNGKDSFFIDYKKMFKGIGHLSFPMNRIIKKENSFRNNPSEKHVKEINDFAKWLAAFSKENSLIESDTIKIYKVKFIHYKNNHVKKIIEKQSIFNLKNKNESI